MENIFTCNTCHYTYPLDLAAGATCPDCGSHAIRKATKEETDWYFDIQEEKKHNPLLLERRAS